MTLLIWAIAALLVIAVACLWAITKKLEAIRDVLRVAHADALREREEEEAI